MKIRTNYLPGTFWRWEMRGFLQGVAGFACAVAVFTGCAAVTGATLGFVWAVACKTCATLRGIWGW